MSGVCQSNSAWRCLSQANHEIDSGDFHPCGRPRQAAELHFRHCDIGERATLDVVEVIVRLDVRVEPDARAVDRERADEPAAREQVERVVDRRLRHARAVRDELRKQLFNHLQQLSLSYFSNTPLGWIMSRVTSDTEKLAELLTWGIIDTTYAAVRIGVSAVFMFTINWQLALIVLLSLPAMMYAALKFRTRIYHHYRLSRKANSKMTASLNENITGVRVVKALRREDRNLQDFKVLSTARYRSSYRASYLSALFQPTIQVISAVSLGLILWRGGIKVELGSMTIGGLQAFVSYIMMILWPIQDLARVYADMQNAVASSERVFSLIDTQPGIHNRPDAVSCTL